MIDGIGLAGKGSNLTELLVFDVGLAGAAASWPKLFEPKGHGTASNGPAGRRTRGANSELEGVLDGGLVLRPDLILTPLLLKAGPGGGCFPMNGEAARVGLLLSMGLEAISALSVGLS
jgi:hypothetical protein